MSLGRFLFMFTCNFEVYLGKKEKSTFGLAYDVVTNLCIRVDNFYSSVHLFKYLLSQGRVCLLLVLLLIERDFQYALGISNSARGGGGSMKEGQ